MIGKSLSIDEVNFSGASVYIEVPLSYTFLELFEKVCKNLKFENIFGLSPPAGSEQQSRHQPESPDIVV